MSRKAVGVDDDPNEEEIVHVMYTDNDKVMSFGKNLKSESNGQDRFNKRVDDLRQLRGLSSATKSRMTRTINKHLRGQENTKTKGVTDEMINGYGVFEAVPPVYNLDYLARLYEINPTHYAAVNAKVSNVISLGYSWVETRKTSDKINELVNGGDAGRVEKARRRLDRIKEQLDDWLEDLNEEDTWLEILEKVYADREIMGQGYLEIGRKSNGKIGYVGHIPANTIRMRRHRDGFVQIVGQKVVFFRNYGDTETPDPIGDDPNPNELLVFRKYSSRSTYYGTPDIISALTAVAGEEFASRFNLDYFEHKAVPRYIIVLKGAKLSPASEKKLIEFFQTNLKGNNHRTIYVPLPPSIGDKKVEFEIIPVETKIQDASFQKYHDMNTDTILMSHRVPKTKVGLSTNINLASATISDKMFKEQVTRPTQENIERRLRPFFKEVTDVYTFKFNELTLTDEETQSKIDERYLRLGVDLPNEVRDRRGMKGIDGGDEAKSILDKPDKAQQGAEARSQTSRGRSKERADDNGSNNSDPSTRNTNGSGSQRDS